MAVKEPTAKAEARGSSGVVVSSSVKPARVMTSPLLFVIRNIGAIDSTGAGCQDELRAIGGGAVGVEQGSGIDPRELAKGS